MGFRFRRSVKILPGIRWNISKSGSSWSFGGRGYTVNVGKRGVRQTVNLPGTGLSRSELTAPSRPAATGPVANAVEPGVTLPLLAPDAVGLERLEYPRRFTMLAWTSYLTMAAGLVATVSIRPPAGPLFTWLFLAGIVARVLTPTRSRWDASETARLLEASVGPSIEAYAAADSFPRVETNTVLVGRQPCYFTSPTRIARASRSYESGSLFLFDTYLFFVSPSRVNARVDWSTTTAIDLEGRQVTVTSDDAPAATFTFRSDGVAQYGHAVATWLAGHRKEFDRRVSAWRERLQLVGESPSEASINDALAFFATLSLTEEEGGPALGVLRATAELLAFERATNGVLAALPGHEAVVGTEPCFYMCAVTYDKRGPNDERGQLYITADRVVFLGRTMNATPWKKIVRAAREGSSVRFQRQDRQNPTVYIADTLIDAMKLDWVAQNVMVNSRT